MKQIKMFYLKNCPYCKQAFKIMETLFEEKEEYKNIEIETIEENEQKELADKYDYWYVPCYYVDEVKRHEGVLTKEELICIFEEAKR